MWSVPFPRPMQLIGGESGLESGSFFSAFFDFTMPLL